MITVTRDTARCLVLCLVLSCDLRREDDLQ